jgi:hypothetical protein
MSRHGGGCKLAGLLVPAVALCLAGRAGAQPTEETPAAVAPTPEQQAEAATVFRDGIAAFGGERYPEALALFQRSYELHARPTTLLNLGMTQRALFDFPAAIDSFREYLRVAGASAPPERVEQLRQFLVEMEAALVLLTVTVEQPGASVLVDGNAAGVTPLPGELRLRPGPHVIEARLEGYDDARQTVDAEAGQRISIVLPLVRQVAPPTMLRIRSEPPGAMASVVGRSVGTTPVEVEVTPGTHDVRVEVEGRSPAMMLAQAQEGQTTDVMAALAPLEPGSEDDGVDVVGSWWFWTIIGAVAVGGAVTAGVLLWPEERSAADATIWVR